MPINVATQLVLIIIQCRSFAMLPGGRYVGADSISVSGGAAGGVVDCPRACFCNTLGRIVYCSRRGLSSVPTGIPTDSVQLNLNGNHFQSPTIQRSNFSALSLLEHLYLSECGIERFDGDAFFGLVHLKWLDLSNNRLKVLRENTFQGLRLQHLFLNGNRNIQLLRGSFEGMATTGLYLHDCSLTHLNPDVLDPLNGTVRYLWLNGNELDRLDPSLSSLFSTLLHIRLGSNPLLCDCNAVWLKELFDGRAEMFKGAPPPTCLAPSRLKGRVFNESSLRDFRCRPPMFTHVEAMFGADVVRLRCSAAGDPAPTLYWIQPTGRATKYDRPTDVDASDNDGVLEIDAAAAAAADEGNADRRLSRFGMFICIATSVAGNVSLTINVAGPQHQTPAGARTTTTATVARTPSPVFWKNQPPYSVAEKTGLYSATTGYHLNASSSFEVTAQTTDAYWMSPTTHGHPTGFQRLRGPASTAKVILTEEAEEGGGGGGGGGLATVEEMMAIRRRSVAYWTDRTFTLTELVGAIVGTHFGTMVAYAVGVCVCYFRRCRRRQRRIRRIYQRRSAGGGGGGAKHDRRLHGSLKVSSQQLSPCDGSSPSPESVFLNGAGHRRLGADSHYCRTPPPVVRGRFYSPVTTPHHIRR